MKQTNQLSQLLLLLQWYYSRFFVVGVWYRGRWKVAALSATAQALTAPPRPWGVQTRSRPRYAPWSALLKSIDCRELQSILHADVQYSGLTQTNIIPVTWYIYVICSIFLAAYHFIISSACIFKCIIIILYKYSRTRRTAVLLLYGMIHLCLDG